MTWGSYKEALIAIISGKMENDQKGHYTSAKYCLVLVVTTYKGCIIWYAKLLGTNFYLAKESDLDVRSSV